MALGIRDSDLIGEVGAKVRARPDGNPLGRVLVSQAKIGANEIERVLAYARKRRLRFGEAAIKLGLISRADLDLALAAQFDYPYLEKGAGGLSARLVAAYDPFSAKGSAIRVLRSQLMRQWFGKGRRALAVVEPGGREGCSYVAANLAVAFSQLGARTVLIDGDLRKPVQHRLFNVPNDVGLSAVLVGRVAIGDAVTRLPLFRDLALVPAGIMPPNAYDLFGRDELEAAVQTLGERYDVVLFDTPPHAANLGADSIARRCGGALAVIRRDYSRIEDARDLLATLGDVGVELVGTTLTEF